MNAMQSKFVKNFKEGKVLLSGFSVSEREKLEKTWDVEHAYYSSALEGSKISRKEFEKLGKNIR